jgi:hypothetical protein
MWRAVVFGLVAAALPAAAQSARFSGIGGFGKSQAVNVGSPFAGPARGAFPLGPFSPGIGAAQQIQSLGPYCGLHLLDCPDFGAAFSLFSRNLYGGYFPYAGGYVYPFGGGYVNPFSGAFMQAPGSPGDSQTGGDRQEDESRAVRLRRMTADADTPAPALYTQNTTAIVPAMRSARPMPSTVLVFRDGSRIEVESYAVAGKVLYEFAPQWTRSIPLSDLDLPATVRANSERGIELHIPNNPAAERP